LEYNNQKNRFFDTIWIDNVPREDLNAEETDPLGIPQARILVMGPVLEFSLTQKDLLDVLQLIFWANCLKAKTERSIEELPIHLWDLLKTLRNTIRLVSGHGTPSLGAQGPEGAQHRIRVVLGEVRQPQTTFSGHEVCLAFAIRSRSRKALGVIGTPTFNYASTRKFGRLLLKMGQENPHLLEELTSLVGLLTSEADQKVGVVGANHRKKARKLRQIFQKTTETIQESIKNRIKCLKSTKKNVTIAAPATDGLSTAAIGRRDSRKSNFSAAFLTNSSECSSPLLPLKQTFPSESFKKAPRVFVSHTTQASSGPAHYQKTGGRSSGGRNPRLEFCAPDSSKNAPKERDAKASPEKQGQLKFPSPKNTGRNNHLEGIETFSLQKSLSEVSKVLPTPSVTPVPPSQEPKRFFNSKTGSSNRKLTEEPKLTKEISHQSTQKVTENLNDRFFSKMNTKDASQSPTKLPVSTKTAISSFKPVTAPIRKEADLLKAPCPQLRPHANSAVLPTTALEPVTETITPKMSQGPIKIEMIVSKASINSTLESLAGRGIVEVTEDLMRQADELREPRQEIKRLINEVVSQCHPQHTCDISNYGSCVTGLITPFSDMDLCIKSQPRIPKAEVNAFLATTTTWLAKIPNILTAKHIDTATVPIIKLTASIGSAQPISIDLSVETAEEEEGRSTAFRTTHFVCDCINAYPSFKPVVLFLKYALNLAGLNDTYKGGLNAYGLSVLYLAFLRTKRCQNSTNIGRLTRDFLRFLTLEFDYVRYAIYFGFGYEPRASVIVPKSSLAVSPAHLVIIDPSKDGHTNVTAGCFMVAEVFAFFGRFELELVEAEDKYLEDAKLKGLLGKFRDLDQTYSNRIEHSFQTKAAWVLSLMGLAGQSKSL